MIEWAKGILHYFTPYKPEVRSITVNHRDQKSTIEIVLKIKNDIKRQYRSVEVPYGEYRITSMMDENFRKVKDCWKSDGVKWKLDPLKLPEGESYLVTLQGKVAKDVLDKFIYIQPAINRDRTGTCDRYWLSALIKNLEVLEKLWDAFNVDDVNSGVNIEIINSLTASLPKDLIKQHSLLQKWIDVGRGRDREKLGKVWREIKTYNWDSTVSLEYIIKVFSEATDPNFISNFLKLDKPFQLGDIMKEVSLKKDFPEIILLPSQVLVNTNTNLTLRQPTAEGFLTFERTRYENEVKKRFPP